MKKEKSTNELLQAFVFGLANKLMKEGCMTRSEAFERAYLVKDLLEKLGQGKVCFLYVKQGNDQRKAYGTLRKGIDPAFDAYKGKDKDKVKKNKYYDTLNFTYWDLEKKGFRTFSALRIIKIIAVSIPNYREATDHELPELIEFV